MYEAPLSERLDLHRYAFAAGSWAEAKLALKKSLDLELAGKEEDKSTCHALRVAFFVLYGRPFKQRPKLRIGDDIVPSAQVAVHNGIITLRDKMFAHSDQDFISSVGDPLNKIIIDVRRPGTVAFGINTLRPLSGSAQIYLDLVDQLIKTAVYRRDKIWRKWSRHLKLTVGPRWTVNVGENSNEVLKLEKGGPRRFSHEVQPP